jgi:hypothetical protein
MEKLFHLRDEHVKLWNDMVKTGFDNQPKSEIDVEKVQFQRHGYPEMLIMTKGQIAKCPEEFRNSVKGKKVVKYQGDPYVLDGELTEVKRIFLILRDNEFNLTLDILLKIAYLIGKIDYKLTRDAKLWKTDSAQIFFALNMRHACTYVAVGK